VEEESSSQSVAFEDCPSTTASLISFVQSLKREFDSWISIARNDSIVNPKIDGDELHPSFSTLGDRQSGWRNQVKGTTTPCVHLDDSPRPNEILFLSHAQAALEGAIVKERRAPHDTY
jgi:hypothetical protein